MTIDIQRIETQHCAMQEDQFVMVDLVMRAATDQLVAALSAELPDDQRICTSSALAVMLQSVAHAMADIDNDATSKMLAMLGQVLGGDDTRMPAYQAAMRHQQERLMRSELSIRARAASEGQA